MGIDIDYVVGKNAIEELQKVLSNQPHGEREKIVDEIVEFVEKIKNKYDKKKEGPHSK